MFAEDILRQFTAEATDFIKDPSRLDSLLGDAEAQLRKIPHVGDTLAGLPIVISMVKSWVKQEYEVQPKVLATIVAAFLYLVKGKDLIPDKIPIIGMTDDLAVLGLALKFVEPEVNAYRAWRDGTAPAPEADGEPAKAEKAPIAIKAVKLYENGFMLQPFAMGGEGADGLDPAVRYRSSLQNFVIDTGSEVILVDTGLPDGVPNQAPDEKTAIYMGTRIRDYLDALKALGYTPDNISKILVTHKHADHTGLLAAFPNATIYASPEEARAQELALPNVKAVAYKDGPYYNFPASEKIADGVYFLPAKGHTTGNSIVIVEDGGLFYMLHGDVTYTDEALYANKLSVVYEDVVAARETLDQVRAFISEHPTVYLSTHTPLGVENLENKAVIDLNNPPESIPPTEAAAVEATGKYICSVCGYVYDPAEHDGVAFEALPDDWKCPRCKQGKEKFNAA